MISLVKEVRIKEKKGTCKNTYYNEYHEVPKSQKKMVKKMKEVVVTQFSIDKVIFSLFFVHHYSILHFCLFFFVGRVEETLARTHQPKHN